MVKNCTNESINPTVRLFKFLMTLKTYLWLNTLHKLQRLNELQP